MENNEINTKEVCDILNEIMEYELAGVVRYTHSSMMVSGPYRLPIVTFLKEQAEESLLHAQLAGGYYSSFTTWFKQRYRPKKIKTISSSILAHI